MCRTCHITNFGYLELWQLRFVIFEWNSFTIAYGSIHTGWSALHVCKHDTYITLVAMRHFPNCLYVGLHLHFYRAQLNSIDNNDYHESILIAIRDCLSWIYSWRKLESKIVSLFLFFSSFLSTTCNVGLLISAVNPQSRKGDGFK